MSFIDVETYSSLFPHTIQLPGISGHKSEGRGGHVGLRRWSPHTMWNILCPVFYLPAECWCLPHYWPPTTHLQFDALDWWKTGGFWSVDWWAIYWVVYLHNPLSIGSLQWLDPPTKFQLHGHNPFRPKVCQWSFQKGSGRNSSFRWTCGIFFLIKNLQHYREISSRFSFYDSLPPSSLENAFSWNWKKFSSFFCFGKAVILNVENQFHFS